MLELIDIRASYGAIPVLHGVSLRVEESEVVALIGPNGAGKTTLLKTISALLEPSSGQIVYRGRMLRGSDPAVVVGAGIAHCPEERKIWPQMTVEEHLELGAYACSDSRQVPESLAQVYREFPILLERRRELAGKLSGGQQQMLAIGRALMSRPSLLLLDEPSLGLSPLLMKQVASIIRQVNEKGVAVLLVEQNVDLALRLARRAYVMGSGKILKGDSAANLRADKSLLKAYLGG